VAFFGRALCGVAAWGRAAQRPKKAEFKKKKEILEYIRLLYIFLKLYKKIFDFL